jgi:signal transduction histidine kinase
MFRAANHRLVAWNVSVLILILVVLGVGVYGIFAAKIFAGVNQQLQVQQNQIMTLFRRTDDPYTLVGNPVLNPAYRTLIANNDGQVNTSTDCIPGTILIPMPQCPPNSLVPTSIEGMQAALKNGYDIRTVHFEGEPQRVVTFTYDINGQPQYIIQISHSVTGEENALKELRFLLIAGSLLGIFLSALGSMFLANRALVPIRQAFARQRQFTADASHELRTPLALIRANAEMLALHSERLPDGDPELVGEIIYETDHLNRLVGDLLTLARADAGSLELNTQPVDFRALVSDVHDDLSRIAEANGIASDVTLDGPVTVQGDEGRLRQLLLILLDNALKYTDPGGRVDISLERDDNRARLVVSDTGIGIPADDLPHIFERFYRVDRAREHESGGTGLGLSIAQWIVQAHHGNIKVDSDVGQGTRFQIELPAGTG